VCSPAGTAGSVAAATAARPTADAETGGVASRLTSGTLARLCVGTTLRSFSRGSPVANPTVRSCDHVSRLACRDEREHHEAFFSEGGTGKDTAWSSISGESGTLPTICSVTGMPATFLVPCMKPGRRATPELGNSCARHASASRLP
jgi:hypothetical protein